jgi:2-hydroxycyclohexanecarboxyl-CoA dehydrogenase
MAGLAIVTGGGGDIGRVTALDLARRGDAVSVWDLNPDAAAETARLIVEEGGRAISFGLDVTDQPAVLDATARSVAEFGPVTILLTGAGISRMMDFVTMPLDVWTSMLAIHATGTFICAQAVTPSMVEAGYGRMVFISSLAGLSGNPGSVHYAAAKAAIIGFAKALAKELGPSGITVNCLAPGAIDTAMLKLIPASITDVTAKGNPMGRVGTTHDVSRAVQFFTEPDGDFITGTVLSVNGGTYI